MFKYLGNDIANDNVSEVVSSQSFSTTVFCINRYNTYKQQFMTSFLAFNRFLLKTIFSDLKK